MNISFSPVHGLPAMVLSVNADVMTVDNIDYDFSGVSEGDTLPLGAVSCPMLVSDVQRISGEITLTLMLPHGDNAPEGTLFPDPITTILNGSVTLPVYQES